jgi:hypothetical protein
VLICSYYSLFFFTSLIPDRDYRFLTYQIMILLLRIFYINPKTIYSYVPNKNLFFLLLVKTFILMPQIRIYYFIVSKNFILMPNSEFIFLLLVKKFFLLFKEKFFTSPYSPFSQELSPEQLWDPPAGIWIERPRLKHRKS